MKTGGIAEELVISTETARTHIQNTLTKLGMHSRLEAAAFVIENGLVDHLDPPPPMAGAVASHAVEGSEAAR
jgi:hypothetical protein